MAIPHTRPLTVILLAQVAVWFFPQEQLSAREVTIRIVGEGPNAQYIEDGNTQQEPVKVQVGDEVVWVNQGNRTHTATAENDRGVLLFDTGDIRSGDSSPPEKMTAELFKAAGGKPGGTVTIDYVCDFHSQMESSLVLSDVTLSRRERLQNVRNEARRRERAYVRLRRDITTLNATELNQYRDAWRRLQLSGDFEDIAGYHGCPRGYCHRPGEQVIFLPWHREYVLRMENALGESLHYWDWSASTAATTGIPHAFTDTFYTSADGNTYPNPLRSFRFSCPTGTPMQTTGRFPDPPSLLASLASQVQDAYRAGTYRGLNSDIDGPHGGLHVWVGGHMGGTTYAAYDPIFWAHHANVDRQWASWQRAGGADPLGSDLTRSLTGFTGRIVDDVKNISTLGYEYDRYDPMPSGTEFELVERARFIETTRRDTSGVGKTFRVASDREPAALERTSGQVALYVGGIPEHPAESYFVYVFVNQPNATPEDAKPSNPNFAGVFGVFGGDHGAQVRRADHRQSEPKQVLTLFEGTDNSPPERITQVTLVTVDQTKSIVSRQKVPFDSVRLRMTRESVATGAARRDGVPDGARYFTGISKRESFDEAYGNAVDQASAELTNGGADRLIGIKVMSLEGERGGIDGRRILKVKIAAWLK